MAMSMATHVHPVFASIALLFDFLVELSGHAFLQYSKEVNYATSSLSNDAVYVYFVLDFVSDALEILHGLFLLFLELLFHGKHDVHRVCTLSLVFFN